jgi:hypothetical protein
MLAQYSGIPFTASLLQSSFHYASFATAKMSIAAFPGLVGAAPLMVKNSTPNGTSKNERSKMP